MVSGTIENELTPIYYTNTGISKVTAVKSGYTVTLNVAIDTAITGTANAWYNIGTVIDELKPKVGVTFLVSDNDILRSHILRLESTGLLKIWIYSDKTSGIKPVGSFTYVSAQ